MGGAYIGNCCLHTVYILRPCGQRVQQKHGMGIKLHSYCSVWRQRKRERSWKSQTSVSFKMGLTNQVSVCGKTWLCAETGRVKRKGTGFWRRKQLWDPVLDSRKCVCVSQCWSGGHHGENLGYQWGNKPIKCSVRSNCHCEFNLLLF